VLDEVEGDEDAGVLVDVEVDELEELSLDELEPFDDEVSAVELVVLDVDFEPEPRLSVL
jgi:hypothetical protein